MSPLRRREDEPFLLSDIRDLCLRHGWCPLGIRRIFRGWGVLTNTQAFLASGLIILSVIATIQLTKGKKGFAYSYFKKI